MKYIKSIGRFISNPQFSFLEATVIVLASSQPFWWFVGICLSVGVINSIIRSTSK